MQTIIPFTYPVSKIDEETFSNLISKDIIKMSFLQERLDFLYKKYESLSKEYSENWYVSEELQNEYDATKEEYEKFYTECLKFGKKVLKGLYDEDLGIFMDTYFMKESKGPDPKDIIKAVNTLFGTSKLFKFTYLANTLNSFLLKVSVNKDTEEEREHWMEIFGSLDRTFKPFMEEGVRFYGNYIYWFHDDITFEEWKIVPSLGGSPKIYAHPTKTFISETETKHFYTSLALLPTEKLYSLVAKHRGYTETTDNERVKLFFLTLEDAYNFLMELKPVAK